MRRDDEKFLQLLQEEQGKLLRLARVIVGSEADAWDLVQEAVAVAYDRFGQFRGGPESFPFWVRRILVNRARNFLRARSRLVPLEEGDLGEPAPEVGVQVMRAALWDEVMPLDLIHRQVLALRFLVDLSVDDIARLLAVPPGTVKSRLNRALKALRSRLEGEEGDLWIWSQL